MHTGIELFQSVICTSLLSTYVRTMTVLPLYWRMWQERPTSLPPPKHKNISSSAGSMGSTSSGSIAACFLLDAMSACLFGSVCAESMACNGRREKDLRTQFRTRWAGYGYSRKG